MRHKKKGRRVYTYRSTNHRIFSQYHPMRSAAGTVLTLLTAAFLGVVGYNIVGPVVTRMRAEEVSPTTTPDPYFTEAQQTVLVAEQTVSALTTTTTTVTTLTETTVTTTTTTTIPVPDRFPAGVQVSYCLPETALADLTALDKAIQDAAKDGFTGVVLPMKQKGGKLLFASANEKARTCGASAAEQLTPREIVNAASRCKLTCAAVFSTLEDHVYPSYFNDGSYTFPDGTTRWLDNKESEGGKAWLNPFAEGARAYLASLAGELQSAGFTQILCTDAVFPHFFPSDVEILGGQITDATRRKDILVQVMNEITAAAPAACREVSLNDAVNGLAEGFDPQVLQSTAVCFDIDLKEWNQPFTAGGDRYDPTSLAEADQIAMIAQVAKKMAGNMQMIPCIKAADMSDEQLDRIVKAFVDAGAAAVYVTAQQPETTAAATE